MKTARLARYAVSANFRATGATPNSFAIAGSEVASTVESMFSMNRAQATMKGSRGRPSTVAPSPREGGAAATISAGSCGKAIAAQQGFRLRLAAAEGHEAFQRRARTAHREDRIAERSARGRVENPRLFEPAEGIGGQYFRPQIAVIARAVAAGKNVREGVRETLPRRRMDHCHLAAHVLAQFPRAAATRRVEFAVQAEIEQREFQLAHQEQAGVEMQRRLHALEQSLGQGFAGQVEARAQVQCF